jgi:hypothetical protein
MTPEPLDIAFACPACGDAVEGVLDTGIDSMTCPHCAHVTALPEAATLLESAPLTPCTVCGAPKLYAHRDFSRKIGLTIVAIGCVLGPFTHWISVGVAILIDFVLYWMVPNVAICYACSAQYRGFRKDRKPVEFDIAIHDAYKFSKRHPPRREMAVAGPLQMRLRYEGQKP